MFKTNILQYTWLDMKQLELILYLVKDYEVLTIDPLIKELKVWLQYTQAIPTWEGFLSPVIIFINTWV